MKTVELKQLNIENYKKFESAEYQFAPRTMVSGRNRQGKTTLMDAYFDTLTGKLADGTSPNNVRRKEDGEEVEGVVSRELTLLIDGEETVIRRHDCHKCVIYAECEHDFARCPELWKDISL